MMGGAAITASHLNKASNIYTMHQISNMHHYLQVEKLGEPEEDEEIGEVGAQGGGEDLVEVLH
jgi:hypothetical protein